MSISAVETAIREIRAVIKKWGDDRFDWRTHTSENITFYWYAGGSGFGRRLAACLRNM